MNLFFSATSKLLGKGFSLQTSEHGKLSEEVVFLHSLSVFCALYVVLFLMFEEFSLNELPVLAVIYNQSLLCQLVIII